MHHPEVVGREFAKQYYFILNRSPENLFRFYKDAAQYDHDAIDVNASQPVTTTGRKGIRKAIEKRCAKHTFRFARLHSVQALASLSDSVIVLVMGEISYDNAPMRPFSQTFMLVSDSPFRYFVANDIFRYTDYVIDDELDESNDSNQLSDSSFINDSGDGRTDVRVDDIVRDVQSMNLKGIILKESHPLTRKSLLKSVATAPPAPEKPSWSDEMEASEEQAKSQNQMFQDQCILSIGDRINPNIRFDDAKETMCDGTPSTLDQTEMLSSRSDEFSPKMPSTSSCDDYIVEDYNVDECVQLGPYKGGDLQDYQHQDIVMQMHPIPHNMGSIFMYAPMTPLSYTMHPYMESWMTTGHPGATIEEELTESTEATPSFEASLSYSNVTTSTQSNEENSSHSMPAAKSLKRRNSKSRRTIDRATATDTPKSGVQQTAAGVQVDLDPKPAHSTVKSTAVQCGSPAVKKLPTASSRKSTGPPMAILASKPIIVNLTTSEEPSPPPAKCPIAPTQSFAPPPPSPASPTATATPPTATYADLVKNPTVTTDDGDKPELEAPPPRQYNSATFSRSEKPRLQRGTSIRNDREKQQKGTCHCHIL